MAVMTTFDAKAGAAPRRGWLSWTRSPWIIPLPGFLLLVLLTLPPFLYAVYLSFVNIDISVPNNPVHFVWFSNYAAVLGSANGLHALMVTLIVSFGSTAAAICLGLFVAYLIHFFAGRLDGFVTILVLIPLAVSPVAMALIFSLMLDPLYGPVPQVIALITGVLIAPIGTSFGALITIIFVQTWQWSPLAIILLLGGIKSLPVEPVEAARIDGARAFATLWHIHLPLLRPILAVAAIFEFILCSQVFAATELLTNGGPGNSTVDLSLYIYKVGISESSQVSVAAAAGIITLILGLLSTAVWLRIAKWDEKVYR
jgi:multiple sugar transport system permease protein